MAETVIHGLEPGKYRTRCGEALIDTVYTMDEDQVTCEACRKAAEEEEQEQCATS
jgi:hypothetical protein